MLRLRRRPLPERLGYLEKRLVQLAERNPSLPRRVLTEILAVALALGVECEAWERVIRSEPLDNTD